MPPVTVTLALTVPPLQFGLVEEGVSVKADGSVIATLSVETHELLSVTVTV